MKKKFLILFLLTLIYSCGFTPIYTESNNYNIKIKIESLSGDNQINQNILSNLRLSENLEGENIFKITLNSKLNKKTISKNLKGEELNYEIIITSEVNIENENFNKKFVFNESFKIDNLTDNYEKKQYENIVIQNLSKNISKKILDNIKEIQN